MSIKFCQLCHALLVPVFNSDKLSFICGQCNNTYPSTPDDTLIDENIRENNIMIYSKILNKASRDPATLKARMDCVNPKCKGKIVRQVRIGDEMILYNICLTCENKWPN